ncbi:hypothetical protein ACEPAF_629 [Sanghuangporus sanghuang]
MSTSAAQCTLVKPVPRRAQARVVINRPTSPHGLKQLAARNGSVSALDPHATRKSRPARSMISKLSIVRVPQPKLDVKAAEGGGKKLQRRQTTASGRVSGQRPERPSASPSRLSFASASFSTPNSPTDVKRSSFSNRPSSPSRMVSAAASFTLADTARSSALNRRNARTLSFCQVERLAPSQIYDLAKVSLRPSTNVLPAGYTPSTLFMPLTEDVYLPFLDRPSEVFELLTRSDNKKLMVLFARMLPPSPANASYYPRTSCELAATVGTWTFEDFTTWLTQVSREEIEDEIWVRALRHFVLPKSEILWERLKGMLGVPPELDVDPDFEVEEESLKTSAKDSALLVTPIYPSPFSSGPRLDGISEIAEDRSGSRAASPTSEVVGLRIATSPSFPLSPAPSRIKAARTVPSSPRSQTPAKGYAPLVSSPLATQAVTVNQPRPRSAPPQKILVITPASTPTGTSSGGLFPGLLSKIRSKDVACPMFPTSFDKLGMQPTLLRI